MNFESIKIETNNGVPIYRQLAERLKEMIAQGWLKSGDKLPSEPQLASQFGINRMTLRRSLQMLQEQNLLVQTPGKGTFVAASWSFKWRIGILSNKFTLDDQYTIRIIMAINMMMRQYPDCDTVIVEYDPKVDDADSLMQKLLRSGINGCIVFPMLFESENIFSDKVLSKIPAVAIGYSKNCPFPSVDLTDNQLEIAICKLIEAGHKKIAYIGSGSGTEHANIRDRNFMECVEKYHLNFRPEYRVLLNGGATWFEQARCLSYDFMKMENPPTAVLFNSSTTAYGFWQGVLEQKKSIPGDISLVGFDCDSLVNPLLSSVIQPLAQIAGKSVEMLINILNQPERRSALEHFRYPTEFYDGKSIGLISK